MSQTSAINQVLAALSCNIISFSFGAGLAFTTCSYMLWISDETPLPSGKLTVVEASLVTSLMCIGCLVGNFLLAMLSAKFGRKNILLFLAIPQIVNLCLFYVATNVYYLYVARFLAGVVGGGAYALVPVYISEIADDNIRGMLGSFLTLICNAGMVFGFVVGTYFEYFTQLKILVLLPIVFFIAFSYFPETPEFLRQQEKKVMAEKSITFFQGIKHVPSLDQLDQEKQPMKTDEKPAVEDSSDNEKLSLSDFFEPAAKKAMIIGLTLCLCNQLSGAWPLMTYANVIFEEAGSTLSPNVSAIIVSLVQFGANCITIALVDRIDRKKLFSCSAICMGIGLASLGLHNIYKEHLTEYTFIPITAFSFTIFVASCGILPLNYVILVEIMPKKIKNVANSTCMTLLWGMATLILQIYPTLSATLGMHTCMFFFAASCFFLAAFTLVFIPETKGKSYETIMRALEKRKDSKSGAEHIGVEKQ